MLLDAPTREHVRRLVDRECRRRVGAQLDEQGRTAMQGQGQTHGRTALALAAFEATGGDPLLALDYALDALEEALS